MPTVGETLKRRRRDRGLTVAGISERTGIGIELLRALEGDDVAALPGPAFGKLYIRAYAEVLEFDPAPLIADYDEQTADARDPEAVGAVTHDPLLDGGGEKPSSDLQEALRSALESARRARVESRRAPETNSSAPELPGRADDVVSGEERESAGASVGDDPGASTDPSKRTSGAGEPEQPPHDLAERASGPRSGPGGASPPAAHSEVCRHARTDGRTDEAGDGGRVEQGRVPKTDARTSAPESSEGEQPERLGEPEEGPELETSADDAGEKGRAEQDRVPKTEARPSAPESSRGEKGRTSGERDSAAASPTAGPLRAAASPGRTSGPSASASVEPRAGSRIVVRGLLPAAAAVAAIAVAAWLLVPRGRSADLAPDPSRPTANSTTDSRAPSAGHRSSTPAGDDRAGVATGSAESAGREQGGSGHAATAEPSSSRTGRSGEGEEDVSPRRAIAEAQRDGSPGVKSPSDAAQAGEPVAIESASSPSGNGAKRAEAGALSVGEFALGDRVAGHWVAGESERFTEGSVAWFATRVVGGEAGDVVRHIWLRDGGRVQVVELKLGGGNWRTRSRKTLWGTGRWSVEARDSEGRVLAAASFECVARGR